MDVEAIARATARWYEEQQKLTSQVLPASDGWIIQGKSPGFHAVVGMSSALTVTLRQDGDELAVEVMPGRWLDKGVASAIGLLGAWPLLFTAARGAWLQSQLPERTVNFVRSVAPQHTTGGASQGRPAPGSSTQEAASRAAPAQSPKAVDVNAASEEQLAAVPEIGASLAARLVAARRRLSGFDDVRQVLASVRDVPPHLFVRGDLVLGPRPGPRPEQGQSRGGRRDIG